MFSQEEIHTAEQKVETGADFPKFAKELKSLGVQRVDVFVINGIAVYFGAGDEAVEGSPVYESLLIETKSSVTELKEALKNHQVGIIDYQTFCKQAAEAGVEKWIIDLKEMTVTYLDTSGNEIVVEKIAN
jgi:uncharacterized protein YbcV (DUF1398 family)